MHDGFPQSLFNVVWNGTRALTGELMSRCATKGFTEKMGNAMVRAALMHVWHYIYVYVNISATPGKLHKEASQGRRSTREAPHAKLYKGSSTREAPQGKTRKGISTMEAPQGNIHTRRSTREAPHGKLHEGSSTREGGANINQNGSTCHTLEDSLTLQNILYLFRKKTHIGWFQKSAGRNFCCNSDGIHLESLWNPYGFPLKFGCFLMQPNDIGRMT